MTNHKHPHPRRQWHSSLSRKQIIAINSEASKAYHKQARYGVIEPEEGESMSTHRTRWRRAEVKRITGASSLKDVANAQYLALKEHFQLLNGSGQALSTILKQGRATDHAEANDTLERREQLAAVIHAELTAHLANPATTEWTKPQHIDAPYVAAIIRGKFKLTKIRQLTCQQLEQLLYTLRNRIAAREGRGESTARNKTQNKA